MKQKALALGLLSSPPALALIYQDVETGKQRKRSIHLQQLGSGTVGELRTKFMQLLPHGLDLTSVNEAQIEQIISQLQQGTACISCSSGKAATTATSNSAPVLCTHRTAEPDLTTSSLGPWALPDGSLLLGSWIVAS